MPELKDPATKASAFVIKKWEKKLDLLMKQEEKLEQNIHTLYSLIWGQCTDAMHMKVEALDNYESMSGNSEGIELLKSIKSIAFNFQSQKYLPHALHKALRSFYFQSQKGSSGQQYLKQFNKSVLSYAASVDGSTTQQSDNQHAHKRKEDFYLVIKIMSLVQSGEDLAI